MGIMYTFPQCCPNTFMKHCSYEDKYSGNLFECMAFLELALCIFIDIFFLAKKIWNNDHKIYPIVSILICCFLVIFVVIPCCCGKNMCFLKCFNCFYYLSYLIILISIVLFILSIINTGYAKIEDDEKGNETKNFIFVVLLILGIVLSFCSIFEFYMLNRKWSFMKDSNIINNINNIINTSQPNNINYENNNNNNENPVYIY